VRCPTLILGGPPKCGTSSLFGWLADHPGIAVPAVKETFYFVDRDSPFFKPEANVHLHGTEGYRNYLRAAKPAARHLLDGTTHTIYQHSVIDLLAELDPQPHLIFVLRKPSRRVYSSFQFARHNLAAVDPGLSFAGYVRRVRERRFEELRRWVAFERTFQVLCRDLELSRYVEHLLPWRERFDRERLHLLLFEEMCADPRTVVAALAARIDVDPGFYADYAFAAANPTVRVRGPRLHRLARRLARVVPRNRVTSAGYRLYLALQQRGRPRPSPEDAEALAELDEHFAPCNERLARAFDLDLGAWG
jgi:Sulfotransferase domain